MMKQKRFTLIELLVVIAVIAILAALLLPALGRARDLSIQIKCLGNFKQIGIGLINYEDSAKAYCPVYIGDSNVDTSWWTWKIRTEINFAKVTDTGSNNIMVCPAKLRRGIGWGKSYAMNANAGAINNAGVPTSDYLKNYSRVWMPSRAYLCGDGNINNDVSRWSWRFFPWPLSSSNANSRVPDTTAHPGGAALLFVDGHGEVSKIPSKLTDSSSFDYKASWLFIKP